MTRFRVSTSTSPNGSTLEDRYEALNLYLTLENGAQPMLEPFRYPTDLLSIVTGQTITNPFADAIEPAITMLGNLGYTNVVQYGNDPNDFRDDYQRDFSNNFGSNGGEAMPFFSFPQNINWGAVPADLATALGGGVQDAFFYGGIPGLDNPPPSNHENPLGLRRRPPQRRCRVSESGQSHRSADCGRPGFGDAARGERRTRSERPEDHCRRRRGHSFAHPAAE